MLTDAMTPLARVVTAMFGTSWSFAAVGNHRANGRAEVQIKTVTAALSKCSETLSGDTNWTRRLALLEFTSTDRQKARQEVESPPDSSRVPLVRSTLLDGSSGGVRVLRPGVPQISAPARPPRPACCSLRNVTPVPASRTEEGKEWQGHGVGDEPGE